MERLDKMRQSAAADAKPRAADRFPPPPPAPAARAAVVPASVPSSSSSSHRATPAQSVWLIATCAAALVSILVGVWLLSSGSEPAVVLPPPAVQHPPPPEWSVWGLGGLVHQANPAPFGGDLASAIGGLQTDAERPGGAWSFASELYEKVFGGQQRRPST
eukprot:TRINITY_DN3767_c0_g1_i2.p2 TRINITY_DN3767_c0_g1~~TRINITY_DN3767_c0_g1_i2.p2  ORF type:complete len:160 (-),score=39.14 TRINITY_DN3767_c0_g1_i2:348-827(-)